MEVTSGQPTGRSYQARVLAMSAVLSLTAVVLISAYLWVLLRMTPQQWSVFGWTIAIAFPLLFALQAAVHDRLWRPLLRCLDARRLGRATSADHAAGFAAIHASGARRSAGATARRPARMSSPCVVT